MIYVSTACVRSDFIKDSVRVLANMGFTNIELSGGTRYYEGYLNDLMELKSEYGLNYNVHNYFPPQKEDFVLNLIDNNEQVALQSANLIREAVGIAKEFGARCYAFHPGYTVDMSTEKKGAYFDYKKVEIEEKEAKEELFYERFEAVLESLPGKRPPICIENLFPFNAKEDFSLFTRPEEIMSFLSGYEDRADVGLLLDLGHLNVSSHYLGFDKFKFIGELIDEFPQKILGVHLSENDGTVDSHQGALVDSWQVEVVEKNRNLLKDIPVTLEWRNLTDSMEQVRELEDF